MKNAHLSILLVITALFAVFTIGFFLGRNQNRELVQLSIPESMLTAPTSAPSEEAPDNTDSTRPTYPVNINTAGLAEFMTLPDIGMVIAQRIIDYREAHGPFQAVEELMNVEGIGEKRMEQLIDLVTIGG